MAFSFTSPHAIPGTATFARGQVKKKSFPGSERDWSDSNKAYEQSQARKENIQFISRRLVATALTGAILGFSPAASAAKRRATPPPPPPGEKKDPNVSGVQAKVLASIKRKEAMKEEMMRLREKGKAINRD